MPKIIQWMVRMLILHAITSNVGNYDWQMKNKIKKLAIFLSKNQNTKKGAIGK
jgi:hypothetical protein